MATCNPILTVCVILCLQTACFCAVRKGLKRRLAIVENRQDDLSESLREHLYDFGKTLDNIETNMNTFLEEHIVQQPDEKIGDWCKEYFQETVNQVVTESQTIQSSLNVVKGDIQSYVEHSTKEVKDDVQSSIEGIQKYMRAVVSTLDQKNKASVEELKLYVDSSIKGMKEEILNVLHDTVTTYTQTVTPTTEPSVQTTVMTTTHVSQQSTGTTTMASPKQFPSCLELYNNGERQSGVYTIFPPGLPVQVYCDMDTDGGGWSVFQRRQDGSVDFYRNWEEYASGFGNLTGEFWLGNNIISALTSNGPHELRVDMEGYGGHTAYAKYSAFRVLPKQDKYKLEVSGFTGGAGDSLTYHNGNAFSTRDQDNDKSSGNCAQLYSGAWWYYSCHSSNLNGLYGHGHGDSGVIWVDWKHDHPLNKTTMMLKARPHT